MLHTSKARLYAGMHVYVLIQAGLIEDSMPKVGQSSSYGWWQKVRKFSSWAGKYRGA